MFDATSCTFINALDIILLGWQPRATGEAAGVLKRIFSCHIDERERGRERKREEGTDKRSPKRQRRITLCGEA